MNVANRIESTTRELGHRIRMARKRAGLKLIHLAERTGLSEGFLSKLERGQASSSIANLIQITEALGLGLDELFADQTAAPARTTVAVHRHVAQDDLAEVESTGYRWRHLAGGAPFDRMEVFHLVFPLRNRMETMVSHPGQEHCYVLSGKIVFQIGETQHLLQAGEGIFIDSTLPHRAENAGEEEAHVLMSVVKPGETVSGSIAFAEWWRPRVGSVRDLGAECRSTESKEDTS